MSLGWLEAQLEALLDEPMEETIRRQRETFDRLAAPHGDALVLFGAGRLGRKTLAGLRHVGVEPLAFADSDSALWGSLVDGIRVMSPREAASKYGSHSTFVVTIWGAAQSDTMEERMQHVVNLGCTRVVTFVPLFWKHPTLFLPHSCLDLPQRTADQAEQVRRAFPLWADEASCAEFVAQVKWRILGDFGALAPPVDHEIYFPKDLLEMMPSEMFVDCGAYDGDTIRSLLQHAPVTDARVLAFEPDVSNFRQLQDFVAALPPTVRERVTVQPTAVGARRGKVRFDATGTVDSAVGKGNSVVDCIALDEALSDCVPTYIKMDIEGSELDAIMGARGVIQRSLPVLAISVYHQHDHLWRIPAAISEISNQYRFYLRPHLLESWDLVCYAVPADRLKG
jgi:FkbM family methyltransferase